ncbi:hypothetical protein D3C79_967260 [compost metagenome]
MLAHAQVGQGRSVGRCGLGPAPGKQVEFGQLLAFARGIDQRRTAVELPDDLENGFLAVLGRHLVDQQATDTQVHGSAVLFGDQRVGGFMDAVMNERAGAVMVGDQLQPDCRP